MSDEHHYILAGEGLIASHHWSVEEIRSLGAKEVAQIDNASEQVGGFAINSSLYEICDANYKELIAHYEKVGNEYRATHNLEGSIGSDILTELNRLLMNYLSSFRTMIDHYETRYKRLDRLGSQWLQLFKSYRSSIYDGSFTYRFFYKLRNYVQHCGLPLGGINADVHRDERGKIVAEFLVYFDRDDLLNAYDDWGRVRKDLQMQPPQMEIREYLTRFHLEVAKLFSYCTKIELKVVSEAHRFLWALIMEVETQMAGATPLIVDLAELSGSGGHLQSRFLPKDQLLQIRRIEAQHSG